MKAENYTDQEIIKMLENGKGQDMGTIKEHGYPLRQFAIEGLIGAYIQSGMSGRKVIRLVVN